MKAISIFTVIFLSFVTHPQAQNKEYVLMVSLDGFRWDYPEMYKTPFLDSLASVGVKAQSLQPSYPSKTFPNHYSMATGLYPDHHGIVHNTFYDPVEDRSYSIANRTAVLDGSFYGGEPIWVTAEKQGVKAASYFWVGSETEIKGFKPSISKIYDGGHGYEDRIDSVMQWLSLPFGERPHLNLLYFDEPDGVGHRFGPVSPETGSIVQSLDSLMHFLFNKVKKLDVRDSLNLIITSDHGMAEIFPGKQIILKNHLPQKWIKRIKGSNPVYNLAAVVGYSDSILKKLSTIEHLNVWKSDNIPDSLHYGTHRRTLDIHVSAKKSWSVSWYKPSGYPKATHGYPPQLKDMHAIFFAWGPSFKSGYQSDTFMNVDLYKLICKLLELESAESDGDLNRIVPMLK